MASIDPIHTAIERVDLVRIAALLGEKGLAQEELTRLLEGEERLRHIALLHIDALARGRPTRAELEALARLLPREAVGSIEYQQLLASLYLRLAPWLGDRALPPWRTSGASPAAAVAWLRTEIRIDPTALQREPPGERLHQALEDVDLREVPAPAALITALQGRPEERLQSAALALVDRGLQDGLLLPAEARDLLLRSLDSVFPHVVATALAKLGEPWSRLFPSPTEKLSALCRSAPEVAPAALRCAASFGVVAPLRAWILDADAPPALRKEAMRRLGDLVSGSELPALLRAATGDPLLFGPDVIDCLRALHRRGEFLAPEDVGALLEVYLHDHSVAPAEVASLAFTCRHALFDHVVAADADHPSWPRRLALLLAMAEGPQGAAVPPFAEVIAERLGALGSDRDARPFLRALGALGAEEHEELVLAFLDREPATAIEALRSIGGPRTAEALRQRLGLADGSLLPVPAIRAWQGPAVGLLWHLTDDAERARIFELLDPASIPADVTADLGSRPDPKEMERLRAALQDAAPIEAIEALARRNDAAQLPAIAELLLRLATQLDREEVRNTGKHGEEQQTFPERVIQAIRSLGLSLRRRRVPRPRCVLAAGAEADAGTALLVDLVLGLLRRPDLTDGETTVLLRALLLVDSPRTFPGVHRMLGHRSPHVRKLVIALLAKRGADALAANLRLLTGAGDIQTARQALLALASIKATWAAPAIAACLEHPNMNIKKTAAEALREAGTPDVVPRLLFWLGYHDNPGFREDLVSALAAILGPATTPALLAAVEASAPSEDRRRAFLLEATSGRVTSTQVRSAVKRGATFAPALLAKVLAGEVRLASGSLDDLTLELEQHGLARRTAAERAEGHAPSDEARALADGGWSEVGACALLGRWRDEPIPEVDRALVRRFLPEWLTLAARGDAMGTRALDLVQRIGNAGLTAEEARALAGRVHVLLDGLDHANGDLREGLLDLLEALAPNVSTAAAIDVRFRLRRLSPAQRPSGRDWLALLRRYGAVITRADLDRALAESRGAPDAWKLEERLLVVAFAPAPNDGRKALREALEGAFAALHHEPEGPSTPRALAAVRRAWREGGAGPAPERAERIDSRAALRSLIDAFGRAPERAKPFLLDWMEELQPLGAARWVIAEREAAKESQPRRPRRPDALDQPRSSLQRERLVILLDGDDPKLREEAAQKLLAWPESHWHELVLHAYLRGRLERARIAPSPLARALTRRTGEEVRRWSEGDVSEQLLAVLVQSLDRDDARRFVAPLVAIWERSARASTSIGLVQGALARAHVEDVLPHLLPKLRREQWGYLDLIHAPAIATPEIHDLLLRARAQGRQLAVERIRLIEPVLRRPRRLPDEVSTLALLRARAAPPPPERAQGDRGTLLRRAREGSAEEVRAALSALAERPDAELVALLHAKMDDPSPRVRLHAHRLLRAVGEREDYLRASVKLLDDPLPDVQRSAIRIVAFARWLPALPALVEHLLSPTTAVRRAAMEGLVHVGPDALPALRAAMKNARPDRRETYQEVITAIERRAAEIGGE